MDPDSNSRDSSDDFRSSTVISVAQPHTCFSSLVDELVMRILSQVRIPDRFAPVSSLPEYGSRSIWSCIIAETESWWGDHSLDQLSQEQRRGLASEVLSREPLEAALLSLGVFGGVRLTLLGRTDIEAIQGWGAALVSTHRVVTQALALMILAPWFADKPLEQIKENLVARATDGSPGDVNCALLVGLGLLQVMPERCAPVVFDVLACVAYRADLDAIDQLGGVIGRLWPLMPGPVEVWLGEHCVRLPRKVFRLAVERLPAYKRMEFTQRWKDQRSSSPHKD